MRIMLVALIAVTLALAVLAPLSGAFVAAALGIDGYEPIEEKS